MVDAPRVALIALAVTSLAAAQQAGERPDLRPTLRFLAERAEKPESIGGASWSMLAFLANGSTMRNGPDKSSIKKLARWLRDAQGDRGLFEVDGKPCSREEQIVATLAMTHCAVMSSYRLLQPIATRGAGGVENAFLMDGAEPPNADEYALLLLLAMELDFMGKGPRARSSRRIATKARDLFVIGPDRRTDAAVHLGSVILKEEHPIELTIARCWPANSLVDPMHTYFGVMAVLHHDPKMVKGKIPDLDRMFTARIEKGADAGAWPAVEGLDTVTTTAMLATAVGFARLRK